MALPDAGSAVESIVPIFPYFYWQWDFEKKNREKK